MAEILSSLACPQKRKQPQGQNSSSGDDQQPNAAAAYSSAPGSSAFAPSASVQSAMREGPSPVCVTLFGVPSNLAHNHNHHQHSNNVSQRNQQAHNFIAPVLQTSMPQQHHHHHQQQQSLAFSGAIHPSLQQQQQHQRQQPYLHMQYCYPLLPQSTHNPFSAHVLSAVPANNNNNNHNSKAQIQPIAYLPYPFARPLNSSATSGPSSKQVTNTDTISATAAIIAKSQQSSRTLKPHKKESKSKKSTKSRRKTSTAEKLALLKIFHADGNLYPSKEMREVLAQQLGMTARQVQVPFALFAEALIV